MLKYPFGIGDRVTKRGLGHVYGGTVVDVVGVDNDLIVYWRFPLMTDGRVRTYHSDELERIV